MEKANKLTEKLKLLETEIYDCRSDLNAVKSKLTIAFDYEHELNQRMVDAKKHTDEAKEKIRQTSLNMSDETKEKIRQTVLKYWAKRRKISN